MDFPRLFVVLVVLAAGLGLLLASRPASLDLGDLPSLAFPQSVEDYPVHWHAHVLILDGNEEVSIPADVGLYPDRLHSPVHTHDDSGLLHVEAQSLEELPPHTLSFFFSVWGQPLTASCVVDICTDSSRQLRFFVNGKERLDWLMYDLADGDEIEFEFVPNRVIDLV